jgi:hypothetical protein
MKTKKRKNKHFHEHIEQALRHRVNLAMATFLMFVAVVSFDGSIRGHMKESLEHTKQNAGWAGTYLRHEHPMHSHQVFAFARTPTTSGRH